MARGAARAASVRQRRRVHWLALSLIAVVLGAIAVEALMAFRVWVQLSGEHPALPALMFLYGLSSDLVGPFKGTETTTPIKPDGILELATIVAVEAYLILALLALGALVLLSRIARAMRGLLPARSPRPAPAARSRQPA